MDYYYEDDGHQGLQKRLPARLTTTGTVMINSGLEMERSVLKYLTEVSFEPLRSVRRPASIAR